MDYSKIQEEFDKVLLHSQDYPYVNTDNLFKKWYDAKLDFILRMGGELIKEVEDVSFLIDDSLIDKFIKKVENINVHLAQFLKYNKDNFISNKTTTNFYCPDDITIPAGMKITKALKFFIEDKELIKTLQNEMSMIIQDGKIEGTLCFSVHPLDFLSLSENKCGWTSCHGLDGGYRAGNLSYMVDKSTFICYLKSKKPVQLDSFPQGMLWNNKKWRVLMHANKSKTLIFAGKQYPFSNESALNQIHSLISKNNGSCNWKKFSKSHYINDDSIYLRYSYCEILGNLVPKESVVFEGENNLAYADVIKHSAYRKPKYTYDYWRIPQYTQNKEEYEIEVGGSVPCVMCGNDHAFSSDSMLCLDCELKYGNSENEEFFAFCEICGERIFLESYNYHNFDYDGIVCEDCYINECETCCECGENFLRSDMYKTEKGYFCEDCYVNREDVE